LSPICSTADGAEKDSKYIKGIKKKSGSLGSELSNFLKDKKIIIINDLIN